MGEDKQCEETETKHRGEKTQQEKHGEIKADVPEGLSARVQGHTCLCLLHIFGSPQAYAKLKLKYHKHNPLSSS